MRHRLFALRSDHAGQAAALAQAIDRAPGLSFRGLMTYPPKNSVAKTQAWLAEAAENCKRAGLPVEIVSNGGTPDLYSAHEVAVATEHRPGTYIYSDRCHVETHAFGAWAHCALPGSGDGRAHAAPDRCVIDAGSKSLSSDLLGLQGHGRIVEHPEWEIYALSEEHGHVRVPPGSGPGRGWVKGSPSFQPCLRRHQPARPGLRRKARKDREPLRRIGEREGAMNLTATPKRSETTSALRLGGEAAERYDRLRSTPASHTRR